VSRPTRGSCSVLPVRGYHPLWPAFPCRSSSQHTITGLVRVRSPLLTESRLMSFPPGTEMFQFPGFASRPYVFRSQGARPSPRLIAACHVLHRLSVPRHPPDALITLNRKTPRAQEQTAAHAQSVHAGQSIQNPRGIPLPRPQNGSPVSSSHIPYSQ
jgi:hypothetical protein